MPDKDPKQPVSKSNEIHSVAPPRSLKPKPILEKCVSQIGPTGKLGSLSSARNANRWATEVVINNHNNYLVGHKLKIIIVYIKLTITPRVESI